MVVVTLSVCILTKDEEENLPRCLGSLEGLGARLLVLDSHSTDRTREIAQEAGALVFEEDWRGMAAQRDRCLELEAERLGSDWVLCLDADEWLDDRLQRELASFVRGDAPDGPVGYELNRRTFYLGAWIDHCGWSPEWRLRLVRAGVAQASGSDTHDQLDVRGSVGRLGRQGGRRGGARLNHRPYRDLHAHLVKVNRYSGEIADWSHARGQRGTVAKLLLRPPVRFVRMFVLKHGYLDGWRGFVVSAMGGLYVFLKYAKLIERGCAHRAAPGSGAPLRASRPGEPR